MTRVLVVGAMFLLGALCLAGYQVPVDPPTFRFACKALENYDETITCEGVEPPIVVVSRVIEPFRVIGLYIHDEPYIFVHPDADEPLSGIIVHETVHYILWYNDEPLGRCEEEEMARYVEAQYTGQPHDDSWRSLYRCENGDE